MKAIVNTQKPELVRFNGKTFEVKATSFENVTLLVNRKPIVFEHNDIYIVDVELEIISHFRWINGFDGKISDDQISTVAQTLQNLKSYCNVRGIDIFDML